jgi:hypothetical protein
MAILAFSWISWVLETGNARSDRHDQNQRETKIANCVMRSELRPNVPLCMTRVIVRQLFFPCQFTDIDFGIWAMAAIVNLGRRDK